MIIEENRVVFIDLEADNRNSDIYERNYVNLSHIVRIEKMTRSEDSKVRVHLSDGTVLYPNKKYHRLMGDIENCPRNVVSSKAEKIKK